VLVWSVAGKAEGEKSEIYYCLKHTLETDAVRVSPQSYRLSGSTWDQQFEGHQLDERDSPARMLFQF
jgi:hypothetical protein